MSASPLPDSRSRAASLVADLEAVVATLPSEAALEVRASMPRLGEPIVCWAVGEALEAAPERASAPHARLTLEEAARRIGGGEGSTAAATFVLAAMRGRS